MALRVEVSAARLFFFVSALGTSRVEADQIHTPLKGLGQGLGLRGLGFWVYSVKFRGRGVRLPVKNCKACWPFDQLVVVCVCVCVCVRDYVILCVFVFFPGIGGMVYFLLLAVVLSAEVVSSGFRVLGSKVQVHGLCNSGNTRTPPKSTFQWRQKS